MKQNIFQIIIVIAVIIGAIYLIDYSVDYLVSKIPEKEVSLTTDKKVEALQQYVLVIQKAVITLQKAEKKRIIESYGLNDEILELRDITDEFRAQIKGLQKEVFVGVQKEGL